MKVDFKNELRNGRTLKLIPEETYEAGLLELFVTDLVDHPYLEIVCEGVGTISVKGASVNLSSPSDPINNTKTPG